MMQTRSQKPSDLNGVPNAARAFVKMHGLGNDFVVIDARSEPFDMPGTLIQRLADRKLGVGCDQFIVMEPPRATGDTYMRIWNPDGGEVEACGNATRCVARLVMDESGQDTALIETVAGTLSASKGKDGLVRVDMGVPKFDWQDIPLAKASDTLVIEGLDVDALALAGPSAVNIGNPHCVFVVEDAEAVDVATLGPAVETHALFPERTNVEFVQVRSPASIRMRVWERGAGITRACGTGACAAAICAMRHGLVERKVDVELDGGTLTIEWDAATDHIHMTGPATLAYRGVFASELLSAAGDPA